MNKLQDRLKQQAQNTTLNLNDMILNAEGCEVLANYLQQHTHF